MALAFLILAHKNAAQVARLFRALHRPEDVVVLHFDRRADPGLHRLGRDLEQKHQNVIVLPSRAIMWGGYRMAAVQIEAMATALRARTDWHHFINLTGQDFPIKPLAQLEDKLRAEGDANYVSWFDPLHTAIWSNARDRLDRFYVEWPWLERVLHVPVLGRRLRRLLDWEHLLPHVPKWRRRWPDFRYYGGSNHVILSRAACEYVTGNPDARRITQWLKHSAHANEIILQTVLLNSLLAPTVVNTHLREIDFPEGAPHPRIYRGADFDRLVRSPKFFARKFDLCVDTAVVDRLETHLKQAGAVPAHR